jgi:carboxylesterase
MIHNPHLQGDAFFLQGGPTGILLIHGFTATTAEVRLLANLLHQAGYTISAPLLPGHYTRPEDLNRVHWQDWVTVCQAAYDELAARCGAVVVGGESTGGLLSLYLGLGNPAITALLLYAPALRLNFRWGDLLKLHMAANFIPYLPKENMDAESMWQGYPVNPLKGAIQLLKLQKQVEPHLEKITQPLLVMQGRLDQTVHPGVPDEIYRRASSPVKEKYWMNDSSHCVIIDKELDDVTRITLGFLERVMAQAYTVQHQVL